MTSNSSKNENNKLKNEGLYKTNVNT